uniref:Salivary trypsin n=1 Tax=Triatoma infestans TaxID=30076 RepID=A6YPD3_TRIIF|nr:salivary trypsin [Triatoma infestans]
MNYLYLLIGLVVVVEVPHAHTQGEGDDDEDSSEYGNRNVPGDKTTNCDCGWANKEDKRIIGGEETNVNEYPMMAGLFYKPKELLFCGGSIITQYHILTAAHCTQPFEEDVRDIQIVSGEHDQDKVDESSSTVYIDVLNFVPHEGYYLIGHRHDIAIILLKDKIVYTNIVGPACMPTEPIDMIGHKIKVLGWGKLSANGPSSKVLMKVYLNVVPLEECNNTHEYIGLVERRQICTYHPTKDSCQGDSGGPLLWLDREINRYVLAAVTSYGLSCATDVPGVNTNISYYMPWIQKVVAETRPEAPICTKQN